jgi:hypothetical protein
MLLKSREEYREKNIVTPAANLYIVTEQIIGCAMKVHRKLWSGFLESVYRAALVYEFSRNSISFW